MLNQDQIQAVKAPFPSEALSSDTSRGFELTSIKAAFVIERLNEVFGPCGIGWRYVHSPFEVLDTNNGRVEIVTEVALQYRYHATNGYTGTDPIAWDGHWAFHKHSSNHDWSEPILACGGKTVGKGGAAFTDARKSAVTDGLTKAASMIGVGHAVFKGQVRVGGGSHRNTGGNGKKRVQANGGNGKDQKPGATAFWTLYRSEGKAAGVPMSIAKGLAGNGDWTKACTELATLIVATKS